MSNELDLEHMTLEQAIYQLETVVKYGYFPSPNVNFASCILALAREIKAVKTDVGYEADPSL